MILVGLSTVRCTREPQKVLQVVQEQPHSDSHQKISVKSAASEPQIDSMGTSRTANAKPSAGVDIQISPGSDSPSHLRNVPSPYPDSKGPDSNPVLSKKPNDARTSVLSKILYSCVFLLTTVMI